MTVSTEWPGGSRPVGGLYHANGRLVRRVNIGAPPPVPPSFHRSEKSLTRETSARLKRKDEADASSVALQFNGFPSREGVMGGRDRNPIGCEALENRRLMAGDVAAHPRKEMLSLTAMTPRTRSSLNARTTPVRFASNQARGAGGIVGSPADDVFLKIGAVPRKPRVVLAGKGRTSRGSILIKGLTPKAA